MTSVTSGPIFFFLLSSFVAISIPNAQAPFEVRELREAISKLGDFDHNVRVEAARFVRRAEAATAVPILLEAARRHKDNYVRYRVAVLSYGFRGTQIDLFFREALTVANDRIRAVAYDYAEHSPDGTLVPRLLAALDEEKSEFVRPALFRTLVAHDEDAEVQEKLLFHLDREGDFFRSALIEALGDYRADYAVERLIPIAASEGPLRDDALIALGKIGQLSALSVISEAQGVVSDVLQPVVSAAACMLGFDCQNQEQYIFQSLRVSATSDNRDSLRSAARAAVALAMVGRLGAAEVLFDIGMGAAESVRAPVALALGTIALRRPDLMQMMLEKVERLEEALLLLRDAFDMLDEDFAEERFYMHLRDEYYTSGEGTATRTVTGLVARTLEF